MTYMETHYGRLAEHGLAHIPLIPAQPTVSEGAYQPKHRGEYPGDAVDIARRNRKNVIRARHSNEPGTYTPPPLSDPSTIEGPRRRRDMTMPLDLGGEVR